MVNRASEMMVEGSGLLSKVHGLKVEACGSRKLATAYV
jgi:hypothetical protein